MKKTLWISAGIIALALGLGLYPLGGYQEGIVILLCINCIAAMGVSLLTGFTGIFTLGHAAYMALGAYAAAILTVRYAVHWLPAVLKEFQRDYPRVDFRLLNGDYHDVEQWLANGSVDVGFVALPSPVNCEFIPLMEDRLMAILPLHSRFENYPKFPLVECETEPFISLLKSSDHDARRALEAAGVNPNVRFYTKDDYAVIAMVEQGLGMSIMPELLLKGRQYDLQILPLVPEAKRTSGLAIAAGDKAGPATRRFADYVVRYVESEYA